MFSKTKRRSGLLHDTPDGSKVVAPPSLISPSLRMIGNLCSQGEVQIDRTMDSDVFSSTLTIGEKGTINGEIVADDVVVRDGSTAGSGQAGCSSPGRRMWSAKSGTNFCPSTLVLLSSAIASTQTTDQDNRASHQTGTLARRDVVTILGHLGPPSANIWPDPTTRHRQVVAATTIRVGLREASGIKVAGNISAPMLAATLAADTCMESRARWA